MLPTIADVLALDVVRRGSPRVLTAADRLDAPVRWVHVIELAEAGHLLRGGELVLSTGIALPPDAAGLTRYVAGLAAAGVSAVAVELGSRYVRELPAALVAAAARHQLPLIVLQRETEFIAVTEAVHAQILQARVAELRAAERLHQVFTDLAIAGAPAQEVVEQASALAGAPVVLEDLAHRVVACAAAGRDLEPLLAGFAGRSRAVRVDGRSGYDRATGWLVAKVTQAPPDPSAAWGRLVIMLAGEPVSASFVLAERAADAVALARLVSAGQGRAQSPLAAASQQLLAELAGQCGIGHRGSGHHGAGYHGAGDLHARITALGVPLAGHRLLLVVAIGPADGARSVADALGAGCAAAGVPALTGTLSDSKAAGLLSLPAGRDPDAVLARLGSRLRRTCGNELVLGTGPAASSIAEVRAAFAEADQAASAAISAAGQGAAFAAPFVRLADLRLGGLLYQLREHPAVQDFAEREIGPLLRHDETAGTDLVRVLGCYLASGGNKAEAAIRAGLARPTLYERLRGIEQVLGIKLDTVDSRLALPVALMVATGLPEAYN
jgi:PucR family transcriptional regulator, purine catabolism regulatory protein